MKQHSTCNSNQARSPKAILLRLLSLALLSMTLSGCSFLTYGEEQDLRVEMNEVKLQMGRLQQAQAESFRKMTFSLEQLERKIDVLDKSNHDLGELLGAEMKDLRAEMVNLGETNAAIAIEGTGGEGVVDPTGVVPGTASPLTPAQDKLLQSATVKLALDEFDDAIDLYSQFLVEYPDSSMAPDATYDLARCYWGKLEFARAEAGFERLLKQYPTCDIIPQTLASCALCEISQKKYDEARKTIERVEITYPEYDPGLVQSIRAQLPNEL